jgi:selenocysteine lyase/cysteine desulfurase
VNYLAEIGREYGKDYESRFPDFSERQLALKTGMTVLREYDHVLSAAILDELEALPGVRIHEITDRDRLDEPVPTVSFAWEGRHPRDIAAALGERGIYVWDGNYYALAVTERLGLEGKGGMVRIEAVHAGEAPVTRWRRSSGWAECYGRWLDGLERTDPTCARLAE